MKLRQMKAISFQIPPGEDRLLPMTELGRRWAVHPKVARLRVEKLKLPLVVFNQREKAVRLSDVIRAELEATISAPSDGSL
jgi:hypothetical protein